MENIAQQKQRIIQWVKSIEDPKILNELTRFSKEQPFDINLEIQNAITAEELKARTTKFIKSLNWKK